MDQEDLTKLIDRDVSHNKNLDKVKEIFIFCCYTGLRFQDAHNLTIANLTTFDKKAFIRFAKKKAAEL